MGDPLLRAYRQEMHGVPRVMPKPPTQTQLEEARGRVLARWAMADARAERERRAAEDALVRQMREQAEEAARRARTGKRYRTPTGARPIALPEWDNGKDAPPATDRDVYRAGLIPEHMCDADGVVYPEWRDTVARLNRQRRERERIAAAKR